MKERSASLIGILLMLSLAFQGVSQDLYFPPVDGEEWETLTLDEAGFCQDEVDDLYDFLEEADTKAFIVLKDGKIALEKYFGTFVQDSLWYWASAGKTLTAFAVGKAQEQGHLDIHQPSNLYMGDGWSSLTPEREDQITVWHHLTMTTGLDDTQGDKDCTIDTCLVYKAEPGTRWAYHNAPYTLLDEVISGATGRTLNGYLNDVLEAPIGMDGFFLPIGYNNVYFSTARSMARYGLLILNNGNWNGTQIMSDMDYFSEMVNPSQDINNSYGYLWWLNGQESFMLPGLQIEFQGPISPSAPGDLIAGLGRNGQVVHVVPSQNIVVVRMGNATDDAAVSVTITEEIWQHLNAAMCNTTSTVDSETGRLQLYPNPARDHFTISSPEAIVRAHVIHPDGRWRAIDASTGTVDIKTWPPGVYTIRLAESEAIRWHRLVVVR